MRAMAFVILTCAAERSVSVRMNGTREFHIVEVDSGVDDCNTDVGAIGVGGRNADAQYTGLNGFRRATAATTARFAVRFNVPARRNSPDGQVASDADNRRIALQGV
jgi:hypothetical protein